MKARRLFLWQAFDAQGTLRRGELMSDEKRQVSRLLIEQGMHRGGSGTANASHLANGAENR